MARERMTLRAIKGEPGDLRVWHIPQVPMQSFRVPVKTVKEAKKILNVLAEYDMFQQEHNVKPDFCNAQGLEVFANGEWTEWEDDEGRDICTVMR